MAHDLEIDEITGDAAFFTAREVAWHQLGTVTPDALTAEDALVTAHLDNWNVRKVPDVALVEGEFVASAGRSRVVRTHPFTGKPDVLGWVSDEYGILSNEDAFAFLDVFGEMGGAKFETAGSISDGRRVFMTMRMPTELLIGGMDPVETYILFTTTHDGNGSAEGLIVPNRVVCRNTLDLAMGSAIRRVRIRHTSNAAQRMQQAAEVLSATEGYVGNFRAAAERLATQQLTLTDVDLFLDKLFPAASDAKAATTMAENKRDMVRALVLNSPTIQDEFRLTGWGVLNAAAEYQDWFGVVRGADDPDARRAYRSTFGEDGSLFKNKAAKILASI
jgi:phage/plasmid-like protein (TIGR03299 family)